VSTSRYGLYRALVADAADTSGQGRVRVLCPQLWGSRPSGWALPVIFPAATVNIGEEVFLAFEGGDEDHPVWYSSPPPFSFDGPAGGDLSGTYPNPLLATIITATGPIGSSSEVPVITVDETGRVTDLYSVSIVAGVSSVFGRSGAVSAATGDYTAAQVVGAADLSATTDQAFSGPVQTPALGVNVAPGATGTAKTANNTLDDGSGNATVAGNLAIDGSVTVGGLSPVYSVFGRSGAVSAATGDYTAAQVVGAADLSATTDQAFSGPVQTPALGVNVAPGATGTAKTANNTLDDGSGNATVAGNLAIDGSVTVGGLSPVGSLIYSSTGPSSSVELTGTGGAESTTVWQFGFPVVNGHTYLVSFVGQLATGGSGTAASVGTVLLAPTGGDAPLAPVYLGNQTQVPPGGYFPSAAGTFPVVATTTGTCVVTLQGQLNGPSTYTCEWGANSMAASVIRVA